MTVDKEPTWTSADAAELQAIGITLPSQNNTDKRSDWAPERVLQAACAGAITVTETLFELLIQIDGQQATEAEAGAVVDLILSDHLVITGRRVACTNHGRGQLARWSKYKPLRCCGGTNKKGRNK